MYNFPFYFKFYESASVTFRNCKRETANDFISDAYVFFRSAPYIDSDEWLGRITHLYLLKIYSESVESELEGNFHFVTCDYSIFQVGFGSTERPLQVVCNGNFDVDFESHFLLCKSFIILDSVEVYVLYGNSSAICYFIPNIKVSLLWQLCDTGVELSVWKIHTINFFISRFTRMSYKKIHNRKKWNTLWKRFHVRKHLGFIVDSKKNVSLKRRSPHRKLYKIISFFRNSKYFFFWIHFRSLRLWYLTYFLYVRFYYEYKVRTTTTLSDSERKIDIHLERCAKKICYIWEWTIINYLERIVINLLLLR